MDASLKRNCAIPRSCSASVCLTHLPKEAGRCSFPVRKSSSPCAGRCRGWLEGWPLAPCSRSQPAELSWSRDTNPPRADVKESLGTSCDSSTISRCVSSRGSTAPLLFTQDKLWTDKLTMSRADTRGIFRCFGTFGAGFTHAPHKMFTSFN